MPSVVESRRIYSETRKKRLQLDEAYELGRPAAPNPDPVNLSSLRCIAHLVLEATKETKQVKQFLHSMGVELDATPDDDILEMCSPRHAVYAIRVREALLRLAELRRVLQERIRQRGVDPAEDRKRKALLKELKNLRKALSTSHISKQMKEVEECLGNLRTLLETYEFSDEVQQYTQKAAGAIAALQGIKISRPIMKAMAKKYARNEMAGSEADPKAAHASRPWKTAVWKTGRGKKEPSASTRPSAIAARVVMEPASETSVEMPEVDIFAGEAGEDAEDLLYAAQEDFMSAWKTDAEEAEEDEAPSTRKPAREASKRRRRSSARKEADAKDAGGRSSSKSTAKGDDQTGKVQQTAKRSSSKQPASERTNVAGRRASAPAPSHRETAVKDSRARSGSARTRRRSNPNLPRMSGKKDQPAPVDAPQVQQDIPLAAEIPNTETAGFDTCLPSLQAWQMQDASREIQRQEASTTPKQTKVEERRGELMLGDEAAADEPQPRPRRHVAPSEAGSAEADGNSSCAAASRPDSAGIPSPWNCAETEMPASEEAPPLATEDRRKRQKRFSNGGLAEGETAPLSSLSSGSQLSDRGDSPLLARWLAGDAATMERSLAQKAVLKLVRPMTQPSQPSRPRWAPLTRAGASTAAETQALVVNAGGSNSRWPGLRAKILTKRSPTQESQTPTPRPMAPEKQMEAKEDLKEQIQLKLPAGWSKRFTPRTPARFLWRLDSSMLEDNPFAADWTKPINRKEAEEEAHELADEDPFGLGDSGEDALTVVDVVRSLCKQDEDEWSEEETTLRGLFADTPTMDKEGEGRESDSLAAWDALAQEQSTIRIISGGFEDSASESEDEEEFLRQLLQDSKCCWLHPLCRGYREMPRVSTAGLPQICGAASPSPRDPRGRHGHVSIEAVLTYRFRRGFRGQLVSDGLEEQYRSEMCKGPQIPCFCRRCLWESHPLLKLA